MNVLGTPLCMCTCIKPYRGHRWNWQCKASWNVRKWVCESFLSHFHQRTVKACQSWVQHLTSPKRSAQDRLFRWSPDCLHTCKETVNVNVELLCSCFSVSDVRWQTAMDNAVGQFTGTWTICWHLIADRTWFDNHVVRAFAHGTMGRRIDPSWGGPIKLFLIPASAPRLV